MQIFSQKRWPAQPSWREFDDFALGTGGVLIDIDTYTRPDESRIGKMSIFVQNNYLKSQSQATGIFSWLLQQQK